MRLLANEDLPGAVVNALRAAGHDLAWIRTEAPGSRDEDVLARARSEARVLVTFDKDFGELVYRRGARASHGVILFRTPLLRPGELAGLVVRTIGARTDWKGQFSVVEPGRVRMRSLPR